VLVKGRYYAVDAVCPHPEGDLSSGTPGGNLPHPPDAQVIVWFAGGFCPAVDRPDRDQAPVHFPGLSSQTLKTLPLRTDGDKKLLSWEYPPDL